MCQESISFESINASRRFDIFQSNFLPCRLDGWGIFVFSSACGTDWEIACVLAQFTPFIFMFTAMAGIGVASGLSCWSSKGRDNLHEALFSISLIPRRVRYILACNQFWRATHKKQGSLSRPKSHSFYLTPLYWDKSYDWVDTWMEFWLLHSRKTQVGLRNQKTCLPLELSFGYKKLDSDMDFFKGLWELYLFFGSQHYA